MPPNIMMTREQTIASTGLFKLSSDKFICIVSVEWWIVSEDIYLVIPPFSNLSV
ncbi:MAG: hypothetical protein WDO71_15345 [Bacteroidota bacterium]